MLALTGLDWNGDPAGRRAIIFTNLTGKPHAPATYIWRVFQRNQIGATARYYTNFFDGNNGAFAWGPGYGESFYGAHPYPEGVGNPGLRDGTGDGKFEISADANDYTQRDDGTSPHLTYNQWYRQAFRVYDTGANNFEMKYWVNLPSTSTLNTITHVSTGARVTPPSRCIIWGQAPDNGSGQSWGGYPRWEEQNGIIRCVQMFATDLSEAHIVSLSAFDYDSEVISYCNANGLALPWYLNMNLTLSDILDKSGNGNHPSWVGTERPTQYTA